MFDRHIDCSSSSSCDPDSDSGREHSFDITPIKVRQETLDEFQSTLKKSKGLAVGAPKLQTEGSKVVDKHKLIESSKAIQHKFDEDKVAEEGKLVLKRLQEAMRSQLILKQGPSIKQQPNEQSPSDPHLLDIVKQM